MTSEPQADVRPPAQFLIQVSNFTLRACLPLYWHDRWIPFPKDMRGGSCFILRFGERLVGITAAHVLQAYRARWPFKTSRPAVVTPPYSPSCNIKVVPRRISKGYQG
jgi:hypothetical protein